MYGIAPKLRREVRLNDPEKVRVLATATGFFYPAEVDVAVELAEERLARGDASEYWFVFAEDAYGAADDAGSETFGYACYGPVSMTRSSWDLYWIAVHPASQGRGVGRTLLVAVEGDVRARGGTQLWVETAGRPAYEPTREFYRRSGYALAAELPDFYAPGDAKIVFVKRL